MPDAEQLPNPQDLVNAMRTTVGRDNGHWVGIDRGRILRQQVAARSRFLDILANRAVRLALLMEAAEPKGFLYLLYYRITRLSSREFRAVVEDAARRGRLAGRFDVSDDGITFLDKGCSYYKKGAFSLGWKAFPLTAAYFDFIMNCLLYDKVKALLEPLFSAPHEPAIADTVAQRFRSEFDAWLIGRSTTEHGIKLEQKLRPFIDSLNDAGVRFFVHAPTSAEMAEVTRRWKVGKDFFTAVDVPVPINDWYRDRWPAAYFRFKASLAETIDLQVPPKRNYVDHITDETIAAFWVNTNLSDRSGSAQAGLLEYRSAAKAMLRYRTTLLQENVKSAEESASSFTMSDGSEMQIVDLGPLPDEDEPQDSFKYGVGDEFRDGEDVFEDEPESWPSPLAPLRAEPCAQVKWVSDAKIDEVLRHVFDEARGPVPGLPNPKACLFGDSQPEERFALTLLRYIHFGDAQKVAQKQLGRWVSGHPDAGGYGPLREEFSELDQVLQGLPYATINALLVRQDQAALVLLNGLHPDFVLEAIRGLGRSGPMSMEKAVECIRAHLEEPKNEVAARIKRESSKVARAGFRKQDAADEGFSEALRLGSRHVLALRDEFARVDGMVARAVRRADYQADHERFEEVFVMMYGPGAADDAAA